MKFSYKDLLLLAGIIVAVIITLTTLVYSEKSPEAAQGAPAGKKSSLNATPSVVVKKLLERVDLRSLIRQQP